MPHASKAAKTPPIVHFTFTSPKVASRRPHSSFSATAAEAGLTAVQRANRVDWRSTIAANGLTSTLLVVSTAPIGAIEPAKPKRKGFSGSRGEMWQAVTVVAVIGRTPAGALTWLNEQAGRRRRSLNLRTCQSQSLFESHTAQQKRRSRSLERLRRGKPSSTLGVDRWRVVQLVRLTFVSRTVRQRC